MPRIAPITTEQRYSQSAWGMQDQLVLTAVPSTADQSLVGRALTSVGALTVAGDYDILIPISGMISKIECHLKATITAGTVLSELNTTFFLANPTNPATWTPKTGGTGDGSLSTNALQTSTIATLTGEQYAWMRVTLGSSPNVTFTQAEYNGV